MLSGMLPQGFQNQLEQIERAVMAGALRVLAVSLFYLFFLIAITSTVGHFAGWFAAMLTLAFILAVTAAILLAIAARVAPKPAPPPVPASERAGSMGGADAIGDRVSAGLALLLGVAVVVGPFRLVGTAIRAYSLYAALRSVSRGRDFLRGL